MKNKNKFLSIIYVVLGIIFIIYDIVLLSLTPGTLLDNLTSFTNIWAIFGGIFIFFGVFRLKKGQSCCKNLKKWIKITLISILGLGGIIAVVCLVFILNPKLVSKSENDFSPDYMIVLGGGIDKNGKLPENVMNRIEVAGDFLKNHTETVAVVTGGKLKWLPWTEAPEMKNQLVKAGIEPERILVEDKALDTIQNLQYCCDVLADYEGVSRDEILQKNILIVTNYFHLRRAQRLAKRMGFVNIYGIGAKCTPLSALHIYLREIGAYIKLNLRIIFTGEPGILKI